MLKYIIGFIILTLSSCKQEVATEFTFMKLGQPIKFGKPYDENIGASVYVKLMPNNDSLFVQLDIMPDIVRDEMIDSNSLLESFIIPNTPELQVTMDNFILHSKDNDTFHFPGNEFTEPVIYDGGRFVVTYKLNDKTKYFTFIINNLMDTKQSLIDRFMALRNENKPARAFKSNIIINTDSIALSICRKMDILMDPPLNRDRIKFVPPK